MPKTDMNEPARRAPGRAPAEPVRAVSGTAGCSRIDGSPRQLAQRRLIASIFGALQPSQASQAEGGHPVQRMILTAGKDKPLRKVGVKEKVPPDRIDTGTLGTGALELLIREVALYDEPLAKELRAEHPRARSPIDDIAQVFEIDKDLTRLETAKTRTSSDAAALKQIGDKLSSAHVLLRSIEMPDEAAIYREAIAAYARRLKTLEPSIKLDYRAGDERLEVDANVTPADRLNYRADIRVDGVWGGLAEAEVVANRLRYTIHILRIDATGHYERVTTIGTGRATPYNLLHLGNHYVALGAGTPARQLAGPGDAIIETQPDGNCMYEAILACYLGHRPSDEQRRGFIASMRDQVALAITDDAIDTSIVGLLAQGDRAGLGPKMQTLVQDKRVAAQVGAQTPEAVQKTIARFSGAKSPKPLDHEARAEAYLRARKADVASKDTQSTLDAYLQSVARAEMAMNVQGHAVDPSRIELPMAWWDAVKAAVGDELLARSDNPWITLAQHVQAFNRATRSGETSIAQRLEALEALEELFAGVDAPGGRLDREGEEFTRARVAVYGFHNVALRQVRANLVALYQAIEQGPYRVHAPGGRPEMHYDVYARGEEEERGQRTTSRPKGLTKAQNALVDKFEPRKGVKVRAKPVQEGLSAAALMTAYPDRFSRISKAPPIEGIAVNVEYYDNQGNPWDQVAGHSFTQGNDDCGPTIAAAVLDHLNEKNFPRAGGDASSERVPSGVILDCSYLVRHDYVRMWAAMIQRIPAAILRARVVEINVPFAADDRKADYSQSRRGEANNMTELDKCRRKEPSDPDDGQLYDISQAALEKKLPTVGAEIDGIRKGDRTRQNAEHPVFRNHGDPLPNIGSHFLEFYLSGGGLPAPAEFRAVYDQPNDILYISGSHYRPFMLPHSSVLRHAFYRVVP